jgi:ABC-2 type transport system permease protein
VTITAAPPLADGRAPARPTLAVLTWVELRKMVDTRSGRWLLIVTAFLDLALVVTTLIWGHGSDTGLASLFVIAALPPTVVLPILGVLIVTAEWSQRTALTTFLLVPLRSRVLLAKLGATLAFSLLATVLALVVGGVGTAAGAVLDRGDAGWSVSLALVGYAVLNLLLGGVMGVAFGMALLSSPLAIVALLGLPLAWSVVGGLVPALHGPARWLDINETTSPLLENTMTGPAWAHLATSVLVWVAVPLAVGWWRVLRDELS